MMQRNKRSQHEIVGFILIVVIVVILGLILLVFYIRQKPTEYESANVENFLQAVMPYTTDCYAGIEPLNLRELTKSCYKKEICNEDKMSCEVLNKTLSELVHESWLVSSDKPQNAYFLEIYYEERDENDKAIKEEILILQEGNCTGSKTGGEHLLHQDAGNIIITLEVCYT